MSDSSLLFAGAEVSSERKPITFAALDENLNIATLQKCDITTALACLREYEKVLLVINRPASRLAQKRNVDFKREIVQEGFKSFSTERNPKQWFETNAQDCYREWIGQNPLPRRTFEGRLQRALILFEQGLRIQDPMESFEEITRYKLTKGIFRFEHIYSFKELDALAAAYLAWMSFNRPGQIAVQGEFVLPFQS